jgi:hypothetical protein
VTPSGTIRTLPVGVTDLIILYLSRCLTLVLTPFYRVNRVLEFFLNVFHKYNAFNKYIIDATTTAINTGKTVI